MSKTDRENTGNTNYRPERVGQYFDEFGIKEWDRLTETPADEVSLFIHTHYLNKHTSKGDHILEVGAGPGRFTQILAGLGTHIMVADISRVQLDLNKRFAHELGFDQAIVEWHQLDICDMSRFDPGFFDCVVAYGGPFSYVLDKRDLALSECLRVLKPGGLLFLSVMSLWGTAHAFLSGVLNMPVAANQRVTNTGDITPKTFPERKNNFMHMFRERELSEWLEKRGLLILDKSASNCLSLTWNETINQLREDAGKWNELLRMELEACAETGCLNMGTHLIVVARKPS